MSYEDQDSDKDESNKYSNVLQLNSHHQPAELNTTEHHFSIQSEERPLTDIPNASSRSSSLSATRSTETTKSVLIQRILDSFKPTSSDSTTNTSLSSIDQTIDPCRSQIFSNKIYIHFKHKNQLGIKPHLNDLLETIDYNQQCSYHPNEIILHHHLLNEQLSYKQKQSILRIVLRRQQIFDRYFA